MGMQVGQVCVVSGGDEVWVGRIVQLLDVVYEANIPDKHKGDVVVHEYSGDGKGPHHPMYKTKNGIQEIKSGNQVPQNSTPVRTIIWAESCVCWDTEERMLTKTARNLNANARRIVDKHLATD